MNIEEEINKIVSLLQTGQPILPEDAVKYHRIVTGQYAFLASFLIPLSEKRNQKMSFYRTSQKAKSEADASRFFDLTPEGRDYLSTGQNMKTMEKLMSTLKLTGEVEKRSFHSQTHH